MDCSVDVGTNGRLMVHFGHFDFVEPDTKFIAPTMKCCGLPTERSCEMDFVCSEALIKEFPIQAEMDSFEDFNRDSFSNSDGDQTSEELVQEETLKLKNGICGIRNGNDL
uniref:Uncharacterized protein n=1 Tax=Caenorhabditis japonica TaxID=281687 RepID=A0A8R1EK23_CAEJA